ncbi:hypothetical protein EDD37DRAFT_617778 [Exophiala viscosa]|uniref:uncharacterized protein n=1 Tax=Exophiala viscosa TaxID=2486360 RepID=UPI00219285AC|nr:hypothetical protein EDD37DRAFT_617778 [Exophiala viscosa]
MSNRVDCSMSLLSLLELVSAWPSNKSHLPRLICLNIHVSKLHAKLIWQVAQPYWTSVQHRSRYSDTDLWLH